MKKRTLWSILLIVIPVVCMMTAGSAGSVMVYSPEEDITSFYSYFDLIGETQIGFSLPLAALLCGISLMLAVIECFAKHPGWLKATAVASFGCMFCAVLPLLLRGQIIVLPNMLVPIAMGGECLLAWYLARIPEEAGKKNKKAPRLKMR